MESKLYCVECNKTRSFSTGSDHKQSSNASDFLLYHAKRTSFSHSNGLLQNLKSKFVPAGETLLPCRRKIPCLEYIGRLAGRCACCLIEGKGCDIERVVIFAVEKRGKTRRNFPEVTKPNAFKNGMCFAVNVIFQLAGFCFKRKVLLFSKGLGLIQWA